MLKATVSGSFHRHMPAIYAAVGELNAAGVRVLSPADPRIVDHLREFLFVASDRTRLKRQVQQRHFEAIEQSNFLWLVCPDGYLGVSAAMEVGWALKAGVPVFAERAPNDVTAEDFVTVVSSIRQAVAIQTRPESPSRTNPAMLLDPDAAAVEVIKATEETQDILAGRVAVTPEEATRAVRHNSQLICDAFNTLRR